MQRVVAHETLDVEYGVRATIASRVLNPHEFIIGEELKMDKQFGELTEILGAAIGDPDMMIVVAHGEQHANELAESCLVALNA